MKDNLDCEPTKELKAQLSREYLMARVSSDKALEVLNKLEEGALAASEMDDEIPIVPIKKKKKTRDDP